MIFLLNICTPLQQELDDLHLPLLGSLYERRCLIGIQTVHSDSGIKQLFDLTGITLYHCAVQHFH